VRRVLSLGSVASNDVVRIRIFEERGHFLYVELPVSVGEENQVMLRRLDAALECGAVALISGMMNNTHLGQLLHEPVANVSGAIFAAVVHHNDLKNWSKFPYIPVCVLNDSPDISLFVECRKDH